MLNKFQLLLFHNTPEGQDPLNSVVANAVVDPFFDGKFDPQSGAVSAYINNVQTEASEFMVSTIPTLIIAIEQNGESIPVGRLVGGQITTANIVEALKQLVPLQSNGDGTFEGNGVIVGGGKELSFGGLGFDLFNIDLPPILWGIKTVFCAYQTFKNSNNATVYLWGAGTGFSAINLANSIAKR